MNFENIIGQTQVKARLIRSVRENRVSHAQLFFGPEGNGALALAVAYAQFLLCTNRCPGDSCEKCSSCLKSSKLVHPDIHFVYPIALQKEVRTSTQLAEEWRRAFLRNPYLNINDWFLHLDAENKQPVMGVSESAEILRKLSLTTYAGEFRVVIMWLPEKMNLPAANKLLKILEEPPDKTLFLLVTENEELLPRTVVSRTQPVKVPRLSDQEIANALVKEHSLNPNEASRIAWLAEGNYNAAVNLIHYSEETFNPVQFRQWMQMCYQFNFSRIASWVEEMAKTGRERQKYFLAYGLNVLRECLIEHYGDPAHSGMLRASAEESAFVKKFSKVVTGKNILQFTEEFNTAILHIEKNAQAKLLFTDLSLKCAVLLKAK